MAEISLKKYKNILGDAKETIEAIQKFISNSQNETTVDFEEEPAASVNRILNSVSEEEITNDIRKIIENL
ncbi:hypothetical protein IJD44_06570 [bacterium]|nr:hypothetical protein [bacterium]